MSSKGIKQKVGNFEFTVTGGRKKVEPKDGSVSTSKRTRALIDDNEAGTEGAISVAPSAKRSMKHKEFLYPDVQTDAIHVRSGASTSARLQQLFGELAEVHLSSLEKDVLEDQAVMAAVAQMIRGYKFVQRIPLAPARQQNPKNADNKAQADKLGTEIARLQAELAGWKAVMSKYGPDAPDTGSAGSADVPGSTSAEETSIYEKYRFVKEFEKTLTDVLPEAYFGIDTLASALRLTGQSLDAASASTVAISRSLRQSAFASLDVGATKDVIRGVIVDGAAPASADEALSQIAASIDSDALATFNRLANAQYNAPNSKTPNRSKRASLAAASKGKTKELDGLATPGEPSIGRPSVPFDTPLIIKKIQKGAR